MKDHIIINVGRQFGSGGKSVANSLGEKLGIKVYNNEILSCAAEMSGFSKDLFLKKDEKKSMLTIANIFGANRYGGAVSSGVSDIDIFKIQSDFIRSIAQKESAIFVGRASDYVLRDMDCLDVFICAPLEDRIKRVAQREGISADNAESLILKRDRERAAYYNYYTFGDWGVASNYDLCLDSSILGIDGSADFIIEFLSRKDR